MKQPQAGPREKSAVLLPAIRRTTPPSAAERHRLTAAARRAAQGDRAWRDAVYFALADWIDGHVERWARRAAASDGSWDLDDVRQEAYLVAAALPGVWDGTGDFFDFLTRAFPAELARAMRRYRRRPGRRVAIWHLDPLQDGSAAAEASLALLESIAAGLPGPDGRLLLIRIRDRAGWDTIARHLGVTRRQAHRRWERLAERLRAEMGLRTED